MIELIEGLLDAVVGLEAVGQDLAPHPKEGDRKALHEAHHKILVGQGVSG